MEKVKHKVNPINFGPLKSQCRVKLRPGKLNITSEDQCHHILSMLRPVLAYKTSGGGTQLGQIEARPFVWVTVTTLICMQAYRPLGSTGLTLSHTLIYVLISPYVLFSSSPPLPFLSPHFSFFFLLSSISFSSFSPCLVSPIQKKNLSFNPALFIYIFF